MQKFIMFHFMTLFDYSESLAPQLFFIMRREELYL